MVKIDWDFWACMAAILMLIASRFVR